MHGDLLVTRSQIYMITHDPKPLEPPRWWFVALREGIVTSLCGRKCSHLFLIKHAVPQSHRPQQPGTAAGSCTAQPIWCSQDIRWSFQHDVSPHNIFHQGGSPSGQVWRHRRRQHGRGDGDGIGAPQHRRDFRIRSSGVGQHSRRRA